MNSNSIAIVGMHTRYPQVANVDHFWNALISGRELLAKLDQKSIQMDPRASLPNFVGVASLLERYESFDYDFFGFSKNEALNMDPQHRLFLEGCWHAIEHAGYNPNDMKGDVGVFGAVAYSRYLIETN